MKIVLSLIGVFIFTPAHADSSCVPILSIEGETNELSSVFPGEIVSCEHDGSFDVWYGHQPKASMQLNKSDLAELRSALTKIEKEAKKVSKNSNESDRCFHAVSLKFQKFQITACDRTKRRWIALKASDLIRWAYSKR